jgi:hypothetical protein
VGPSLSQRFRILLFLFVISSCFGVTAVWAAPIPLHEYRSRVTESIDLLQSRKGKIPQAEVALLEERFPLRLAVSNDRGETFHVDNTLIRGWIKEAGASPRGRSQLLTHLKALSGQLSERGKDNPFTGLSWEKSRGTLEKVFREKEFQHLKETLTPPWKRFLLDLLRQVMGWLREHLGGVKASTVEWIVYTVYGLLILAALILMVWIVRSSDRPGWSWRRPRIGDTVAPAKAERPLDWHELRAMAERKAQEGALREAVRTLFLSALLEGHSKGWWVDRPEATNTEHLADLRGPEVRREALRRLTDLYERAWYGLKEPGSQDFLDCRNWLLRMEAP